MVIESCLLMFCQLDLGKAMSKTYPYLDKNNRICTQYFLVSKPDQSGHVKVDRLVEYTNGQVVPLDSAIPLRLRF